MNLPDWLKNALVLLGVILVLWVVWALVKVILTVVLWAVALGVVGFALKYIYDRVKANIGS
jgi:putative flippase GtrA